MFFFGLFIVIKLCTSEYFPCIAYRLHRVRQLKTIPFDNVFQYNASAVQNKDCCLLLEICANLSARYTFTSAHLRKAFDIHAAIPYSPLQVGDFCILPNDTAGWECSYNQHLNANAYTPSPPPVNRVCAVVQDI